tara:strand:- start:537 stop:929 length:393 start_codon:yes stop_codon:yes gene_type:complete
MMKKDKIKISSNKSFGLFFSLIFFIISIWPLINGNNIRIWPIPIAVIFLLLGVLNSKLLLPLNKSWFKFGLLLGSIVSPIIMGLIFFLIVTPTGLILKLFRKDVLNLKYNKSKTYWLEKDKNKSTMKNQF